MHEHDARPESKPPRGFPAHRLRSLDNRIAYRERQIASYQARLAEKQLSRNAARWTRTQIKFLEKEIAQFREAARLLLEEWHFHQERLSSRALLEPKLNDLS